MQIALLSAVAGFVDAAGFAALIGLFPAHLTGELVGDAIALSTGRSLDHPTRIWMLPVFVLAVGVATVVSRLQRRRGRPPLGALLVLVTFALALFAATGAFLLLRDVPDRGALILLSGSCAVAAMGFQNTLMRESLNGLCPTTVMTGNLTQFVIELVDRLFVRLTTPHGRTAYTAVDGDARLRAVTTALVAFLGSAMLGGFLTSTIGALSVLIPTVVTGVMAVRALRHERRLAELPAFSVRSKHFVPRGLEEMLPGAIAPRIERTEAAEVASETRLKSADKLPR